MLQPLRIRRLRQGFLDQLAAVDGGPLRAAVVEEGQAHVVQAQQVQLCGVDIVDVDTLGLAASGYEPPSPTGLPGGRIL